MTKLIDEYPLLVLPTLAVVLGLNEAIFLQQVHFLTGVSKHERDGRKWCYNSAESWAKVFPFWSPRTIQRIISNLERQGVLKSANYNKLKQDRTKWYTIDYTQLEMCINCAMSQPLRQVDVIDSDKLAQ